MTTQNTTEIITTSVKENAETVETTTAQEIETVEVVGVETFPEGNSQVDNMVYTLPMMGKGMLGIFIVTLIIIVSVAILNKTTGAKTND